MRFIHRLIRKQRGNNRKSVFRMLRRSTAHACKWRIKSDMEGKLIFRFAVLFCRRGVEGGDDLTLHTTRHQIDNL